MANIVLDGDSSSPHGHIVTATGGVKVAAAGDFTVTDTGDVIPNWKKIAITGDSVSNAEGHTGTVSGTHCSITINDKVIIIAGDSVSCGDTMEASSSVSVSVPVPDPVS